MIKSFEQNGATYTFNMKHVFTYHKLWLDDFANIPHYFSVGCANMHEFAKVVDRLIPDPGQGVKYTGYENVCGDIHMHFSADSREGAYRWKEQKFDPLFREQAVDFFKQNNYLPYNFAGAFCFMKAGESIEFHGKIPCWAADLDKVNPLKEPQAWNVVSSDDYKTVVARNGRQYQLDTHSLFDEQIFLREYIQKTPDFSQQVNCAAYVYRDPSAPKAPSLDQQIKSADARLTSPTSEEGDRTVQVINPFHYSSQDKSAEPSR